MPTRSSIKRPRDFNQRALEIVKEATGQEPKKEPPEKNPHAVALGRLGGKKGGKARAAKLTPEERQEIARRAALARWGSASPGRMRVDDEEEGDDEDGREEE